ncbi:right-handed parallel beta-helix repeat-containing protein [Paenibacillus sp. KQZ6P-2]|uniref:Right-handed parallel beta-helix repeat-containing protein n=1 Tax=Paenibacillus mangrovi TaxID=2931978 RepID=A0A9X1WPW3_9BACL|nr:NosD domain-containing protein [Paenibacillus mangrovi]MCJ8012476.1 right-handed parallel beta-helix repeat-containing protein [Paenibacillus mangrovi]
MLLIRVRLVFVFFLLNLICIWKPGTGLAEPTPTTLIPLQPVIDRAQEGDTILLSPGTYLGPVTIDKKISIQSSGSVTLVNNTQESAISIHANGVLLQGLNIEQNGDGESAGVELHANDVQLKELVIHTKGYGILLRDSNRTLIQNNRISGFEQNIGKPEQKGNGIDLYNSHDNQILGNKITSMRDAIYMEKGRNETIKGNQISYSRYAIHCMYIDDSLVSHNEGEHNFTGAMVMVVRNTTVSDNSFRKQNENVYAQGMLLYDVQKSVIKSNVLEGNRVGIYMENASDNQLSDNVLLQNFVGIQMIQSEQNLLQHNAFVSNVVDTANKDSSNQITGNYWDSFQGIDITNDGFSDISYSMNSFYQNVISSNAAYQLFFQSPGMTFLSEIFTGDQKQGTRDNAPMMKMDIGREAGHGHATANDNRKVVTMGVMLLLAAISTIIIGGIRK